MQKDLNRIQSREERAEKGPWKWQIVDRFKALEQKLEAILKALHLLTERNETTRRLSEAGKKSAAARKAKFGSAHPSAGKKFDTIIMDDLMPTKAKVEIVSGHRVHESDFLTESLREPVRKKSKKEPPESSLVWDAYELAYKQRHNYAPIRNAKVNAQCKEMVRQLGAELAAKVVAYYVGRNDAFYVNAKHPLGLCVLSLQKLVVEMQNGADVTMSDARRIENQSQNDRVIRNYAERQQFRCLSCNDRGYYLKPGPTKEQVPCGCIEHLREQVHVKEVENADSLPIR